LIIAAMCFRRMWPQTRQDGTTRGESGVYAPDECMSVAACGCIGTPISFDFSIFAA